MPQSAAAARFLHPPLSSRTARFPRSGWKRRHLFMEPARRTRSLSDGAHALRCPCGLLHASSGWMVADSPDTVFRLVLPLQTVFARGSFTPEALPSFIATTSPCADPGASHLLFVLRTYRRRPCRLHHQRLVIGTLPLWSVFLSWSAAPLVPAVRRVHLTSSSPSTSAFASLRWLGSSARVPTKRLPVGLPFRYGRHSFMLRPSSLFALLTVRHHQLAPEDVLHPSLLSLRCLRDSRVCYPADWSIAGAGLSPARKTAAVGCTVMMVKVGYHWPRFRVVRLVDSCKRVTYRWRDEPRAAPDCSQAPLIEIVGRNYAATPRKTRPKRRFGFQPFSRSR